MKKMDHSKTKKCTGCKQMKELDDFHRNRSAPDGRACRCKACLNPGLKERARERVKEQKMWSPI